MIQELQFIPFTSPADKGWDEAWTIYENSFPYKECRSLEHHIRALKDPHYVADGVWLGDKLVGIFYHWRIGEGFHYCEHLAISPSMRGQDMGTRTLTTFCKNEGCVVLEIDPPVDQVSILRRHFYQRVGFCENPHEYLHPSFRQPFTTHKLVLMSYPALLSDHQASQMADFVREVVLRYSDHTAPTLPKLR